jgi:hypothetical protein
MSQLLLFLKNVLERLQQAGPTLTVSLASARQWQQPAVDDFQVRA